MERMGLCVLCVGMCVCMRLPLTQRNSHIGCMNKEKKDGGASKKKNRNIKL